jgi:hypothetical protein
MRSWLRAARFVPLLLSAAWLVAGVLAQVHRVAVVHAYCATHGVVEDRGEPEETRQPDGKRHAGHETCAFAVALHPVPLPDPIPLISATPMAARGATLAALVHVVPSRCLLHAAPKTSPPATLQS